MPGVAARAAGPLNGGMLIETMAELEALYPAAPTPASTVKEVDYITPSYAALIAASPFVALATSGPGGLDCSPRGDLPGFVRVADARTLIVPDRRGNNRIDSLRNIMSDPRVALLFLIPGSGTTFRVNGRARISADRDLLNSFAMDGQRPRSVLIVSVQAAYFQCARAVIRSGLWDETRRIAPGVLPSAGEMLAEISGGAVGGEAYDTAWPARAAETLW